MGFSGCGKEVATQIKVQSHSGCDQVLTAVPHFRRKVNLLQKASKLGGIDVFQPFAWGMRQAKHTENKKGMSKLYQIAYCVDFHKKLSG